MMQAVRIEDLTKCVVEVTTQTEIVAALQRRARGDLNAFWLSPASGEYPLLHVAVNGPVAHLHFFPREDHPGFQSVGSGSEEDEARRTTFLMTGLEDEMDVSNTSVVPFSVATTAANEFAVSDKLPTSVKWLEL